MIINDIISAKDGKSHKVLQITDDRYVTETGVFDDGKDVHLCLSSQLGCSIGCKMCYNGVGTDKHFFRSLSAEEIITQALNIVKYFQLNEKYERIFFSFMGVGEPMLNYDNVIAAIKKLDSICPNCGFAIATTLPKYDRIKDLIKDLFLIENFKLTISLHAPTDEKRKYLIPTHKSMQELRNAMELYKKFGGHKCEWNYVLLKDFNDKDEDFENLTRFLYPDDRVKISSYNPIDACSYEKSDRFDVLASILKRKGIYYSQFSSIGDEIDVGCGQMAAKRLAKLKDGKNA